MKFLVAAVLIVGCGLSSVALAADEPNVVFASYSIVRFDDDTIDGRLNVPDAAFVQTQQRRPREPLVRPRASFRVEILRSLSR